MDTSDFDERIATISARMDQLRANMDEFSTTFVSMAAARAIEWGNEEINETIASKPEAVKGMGTNLGTFKAEFKDLLTQIPALAQQHLGLPGPWPHRYKVLGDRSSASSFYSREIPNRNPEVISQSFRELLGHFGDLLSKYKLLDANDRSTWEPLRSSTGPSGTNRLVYRYGVTWSEGMRNVIADYADLYEQLLSANAEMQAVEKEKATAEAKYLWEQA